MSFLYITADKIGMKSGGGVVTLQESKALEEFAVSKGEAIIKWGRDELVGGSDPWDWDQVLVSKLCELETPKLTQLYSGSFSSSVRYLKSQKCKVVFTCAAHRVSDSKKAHEDLGIQYNYPHLVEKDQWKKYSAGYFNSDVLVVPSKHSELVVNEQMDDLGVKERPKVVVIPHGCEVPIQTIKPLPSTFIVGYLGSFGADKGLRYLLAAWKKLNYKGAILRLGGKDSTSNIAGQFINAFGGGSIHCAGWQDKLSDFYDNISLYVQPSATEGFGIEVLEAQAHGRVALCSDHAGAVDVVHDSCKFKACNIDELAERIDECKKTWDLSARGILVKQNAQNYTWDKIRNKYKDVWDSMMI